MLWSFVLFLALTFPIIGQVSGGLSITGRLLNSESGDPVKYGLVRLSVFRLLEDQSDFLDRSKFVEKSVQSGPSGAFAFSNLPPGNYLVSAEKPGFRFEGTQTGELRASISDLVVKMAPLGVIMGKVVDENGEPLRAVNILVLSIRILEGRKTIEMSRSIATNDLGVFRAWGLSPGDYYIKADGKSGGSYQFTGEANPSYSAWEGFDPVYAGGGSSIDTAQPVRVGAGTVASVNFRLALKPAYKIRGVVTNLPSGIATFELLRGTEYGAASRASVNSATGKFEVQDVTPGSYVLRVGQAQKYRAELAVAVQNSDLNGVNVTLAGAVDVPVEVHVSGGTDGSDASSASAVFCSVILAEPPYASSNIHRTDIFLDEAQTGQPPDQAGRQPTRGFRQVIKSLLPGLYSSAVSCAGAQILSAHSGQQELLAESHFAIEPGVSPQPIEIEVKRAAGLVAITVSPGGGSTEPAAVLFVPTVGSVRPAIFPLVPAAFSKQFQSVFPLAPGDYVVYGLRDLKVAEYLNPAWLQKLQGGISLHVEDAKRQELTLTTFNP